MTSRANSGFCWENLLDIQLDFDLGEEMLVSHCASLENGKLAHWRSAL